MKQIKCPDCEMRVKHILDIDTHCQNCDYNFADHKDFNKMLKIEEDNYNEINK